MSTRLAKGGRLIDRTAPVEFSFNGKRLKGFQGDTLAAGLLANDQLLVGRSFSIFGLLGYLDIQVGARTRGGRADELIAEQTLGLRPTPRLLALVQVFTAQTLESARRRTLRGAPQGERRVKAQFGLVYDVTPQWALGVAVFRTVLIREGARETGATLSLWRRF